MVTPFMLSPAYPRYAPGTVAWRIPHGLAPVFREVGGVTVVHNPESGDTHFLAPAGADLLARLASGEVLTVDTLPQPEFGTQTGSGDVLRELHLLGLAEPFHP